MLPTTTPRVELQDAFLGIKHASVKLSPLDPHLSIQCVHHIWWQKGKCSHIFLTHIVLLANLLQKHKHAAPMWLQHEVKATLGDLNVSLLIINNSYIGRLAK